MGSEDSGTPHSKQDGVQDDRAPTSTEARDRMDDVDDVLSDLGTPTEEEILDRLQRNDIDLDTTRARNKFLERYRQLLGYAAMWDCDGNILHRITRLENVDATKSASLVRLLVLEFPGLVWDSDSDLDDGDTCSTALHLALELKTTHIAQAMVDTAEDIDKILSIQDKNGMNCIHVAVKSGTPLPLVLELIHKASRTALRDQDHRGMTPLHYAVEYDRCTPEQVDVVEALLRKDDGPLDFMSDFSRSGFSRPSHAIYPGSQPRVSPYHHHLATIAAARKTLPANGARDIQDSASRITDTLKLWILRTRSEEKARRLLCAHDGTRLNAQLSFTLDRDPEEPPITISAFTEAIGTSEFHDVLALVSLGNFRMVGIGGKDSNPASREDALVIFKWLRSEKKVRRVIRVMIKDLSTPSHNEEAIEQALSRLHVEHLDWQIADICPAVVRGVGDFVATLALYWSGNNAVLRGWSEPEGLPRLPNLNSIRLTILENFQYPDRVRRNLDTFKARMLALKPGVQIEVLGVTGLGSPRAPFKSAEHSIPSSRDRWLSCINTFIQYLDSVEKKLALARPRLHSGRADKLPTPRLRIVALPRPDEVSAQPRNRSAKTENASRARGQNPPEDKIRIALLDCGVDIFADGVRGRIRIHNETHPPGGDTRHGTHMAALILKVCPRAEVQLFKVDVQRGPDGKDFAVPSSVARAIENATQIDPHIDIMCIPWEISIENDGESKYVLQHAVRRSSETGITVLCPHSTTSTSKRTIPSWGSRDVINIDAAVAEQVGSVSTSLEDIKEEIFYFPGDLEIIDQGHTTDLVSEGAVATAMAAGLAATILRCCRLAQYNEPGSARLGRSPQAPVPKLKYSPASMKRAFQVIARGLSTRNAMMPIWDFFEVPTSIGSASGGPDLDTSLRFLSDLVRRLDIYNERRSDRIDQP
ncbi:hypothetical protein QBC34DRAFT_413315 [Podospora aff. communis PSN243]|uniref:Peptidase S8/S53 domain-containing protein n=1 Tax=Podospora aff. communis PSN243 TaxID=3040156 RepID=A0AAV9GDR9_9PEZI|nr:hypothetical protein QBC34DRAFT_413315 [Podospora aff. communis PSN243]